MTFEERLKETKLPEMAILLLPSTLSEDIKRKLAQRNDLEDIVRSVIQQIDNGSISTIEELIKQRMSI